MQHSHGIDLQYAPICLYLALSLKGATNLGFIFKSVLLWMIAMLAWMSYPTFIFYLLPLGLLFLWQLKTTPLSVNSKLSSIILSVGGFLLPLILGLSYLKDAQLALYDHVTKSGIFRGAGTFQFNFTLFFNNLTGVFRDLFDQGQRYQE